MKIFISFTLLSLMTQSIFANAFFAYSFGFPDLSGKEQVAFLSDTGYDGIACDVWSDEQLVEFSEIMLTTQVQSDSFQVFGVYFPYDFRNDQHRRLVSEALRIGKTKQVPLWLAIKSEEASDERVIQLLRDVCDEAAQYESKVVYYPHDRHFVMAAEDSLTIIRKANRSNLSTSIQLNHELRAGNQDRLDAVIQAAVPMTSLATISGAKMMETYNTGSRDWSDVIQPLATSPYNVKAFVQLLRKHGYQGPVGLQNFKMEGDVLTHHREALETWNGWKH